MTISVIIPTMLSKPELLLDCLSSLNRQKSTFDIDVYIICNTSQSDMDSFVDRLSSVSPISIPLHWQALGKNTGFTGASNAGIQCSSGEVVILLNDDTTHKLDWLENLVQTHLKTGADMVASTIYLSDKKTLDSQGFTFRWRGQALTLPSTDNSFDDWRHHPDLIGLSTTTVQPFGPDAAAALYSRKLLNELAGFRPSFFAYLEDVELALRARLLGYTCVLAANAVVYHHKHATSSGMSNFKAKQDLLNWWKIVTTSYPWQAWVKFGPLILLERLRNLSGWIKALWNI